MPANKTKRVRDHIVLARMRVVHMTYQGIWSFMFDRATLFKPFPHVVVKYF